MKFADIQGLVKGTYLYQRGGEMSFMTNMAINGTDDRVHLRDLSNIKPIHFYHLNTELVRQFLKKY